MRLAIPTLILAIILVLGWRVCSGGERDHLRLTEEDLPVEMRQGYEAASDEAREAAESGAADLEALTERAESATAAQPTAPRMTASGTAAPGLAANEAGADARSPAQAVSPSAEPDPGLQVAATGAVTANTPDIEAPRLPSVSASSTAPRAAATSETEAGRIYIVQPGDWLMQIARDQYGDAAAAERIARRNGLDDADRLKPGQKLVLP